MIVCYFVSSTAHKSPQIKPSTLFMQARVDWVLNIFGTQVTKENRPVRPVFPDYLSVSYDCGLPLYFETFKVGFSLSKKVTFVSFHESPLKMMKNAFYFMLKELFLLEIFTFLS